MTLNCVMYDSKLQERISSCNVVNSLHQALRLFRNAADVYHSKESFEIFPYVMRVYNNACSFWIGLDKNGGLIIANSRSDFRRFFDSVGGVQM